METVETSDNCSYRWLETGFEALNAMVASIEGAKVSVSLEIYIFTESEIANRFRDALVAAAERGCVVRIVIDAWGSIDLRSDYWKDLTTAGGDCRWFNPLKLKRLAYRNHRKSMICDEKIAYIGGFNIAPEYYGDGVNSGWRDLGVEIKGAPVRQVTECFNRTFDRAELIHGRAQYLKRPMSHEIEAECSAKLLLNSPGFGPSALKSSLAKDLENAKNVRIICAYFQPNWKIRRLLIRVARTHGLQSVSLLLAGKTDVALSKLASHKLYSQFLRAGIKIYEYQPQILHAKLVIVDDVVYVGSSNLDARSLHINYELLLRIENKDLAEQARVMFDRDLERSHQIELEKWTKRSLLQKFKERIAYFLLTKLDPYLALRKLKNLR
ncbi:MAG: phosphatidylserine/phosphatidylglycerophosphate/cardiolipin synthase family protein [Verrucomicrobiota bacterium]|nr:phosphatidylserine/phosphatidylglycerophosphate/cardiolipin synthase family protein [Verrucomicrobiota bacterium]